MATTSSSAASSHNIRVFVTFKEDPVFAGEDIEAVITFTNTDVPARSPTPSAQPRRSRPSQIAHSRQPSSVTQAPSRPTRSRQASISSTAPQPPDTTPPRHRQAHSLNILGGATTRQRGPPSVGRASVPPSKPPLHHHGRSISIVSWAADGTSPNKKTSVSHSREPSRPGFTLARSASVQVTPSARGLGRWGSQRGQRSPSIKTPLTGIAPSSEFPWGRLSTHDTNAVDHHPSLINVNNENLSRLAHDHSQSGNGQPGFKFPPAPAAPSPRHRPPSNDSSITTTPTGPEFPTEPAESQLTPNGTIKNASPKRPPVSRVFSLTSESGTPRSSSEVNSTSNNSEDTTLSEYMAPPTRRLLGRIGSLRHTSLLSAQNAKRRMPESLMMGFAQLSGSFTLDESLVSQGPFEEVKRKAVVGGQGGGGVVGIEKARADGGLFGGFNWGNIGDSLGGFLKSGEPSSMREMKGIASSKSIPLLSTPKSILFVDLKLAPGESRSFRYAFPLPRGLPPSHKGRAIRVSYQLIIGLQRPSSIQAKASRQQQAIRQVDIPIRVFGSVNSQGESLGHDLMSPYIILKDSACTETLGQGLTKQASSEVFKGGDREKIASSEPDFRSYVSKILMGPRNDSAASLVSSSAESRLRRASTLSGARTSSAAAISTRDLIDDTIRQSTKPMPQGSESPTPATTTSQTQFTIARAGQPVAKLSLSRPALRLGDVLHFALDFSLPSHPLTSDQNQSATSSVARRLTIPVLAIAVTLESVEAVDPALAIRSRSSVERATRKLWDRRVVGGASAMALGWNKRLTGSLKVPVNATPGFTTTGVGLGWYVRVEIVVEAGMSGHATERLDNEDSDDEHEQRMQEEFLDAKRPNGTGSTIQGAPKPCRADQLLEQVNEDERGTTLAAVRRLGCESFEVMVPVRVFGTGGIMIGRGDDVARGEQGLAV